MGFISLGSPWHSRSCQNIPRRGRAKLCFVFSCKKLENIQLRYTGKRTPQDKSQRSLHYSATILKRNETKSNKKEMVDETIAHNLVSHGVLKTCKSISKSQNRMIYRQDTRTWISSVFQKSRLFSFPTFEFFYRFLGTFQFSFVRYARHRLFLMFPLINVLRGKLARGCTVFASPHMQSNNLCAPIDD